MNSRIYHFLPECIAFNQSALTHCATFYQSALCHEQHEDVILSLCVDSSWRFCSDLLVKRYEGDHNSFFCFYCSIQKFVNLDLF